jgi:hypothetical protein
MMTTQIYRRSVQTATFLTSNTASIPRPGVVAELSICGERIFDSLKRVKLSLPISITPQQPSRPLVTQGEVEATEHRRFSRRRALHALLEHGCGYGWPSEAVLEHYDFYSFTVTYGPGVFWQPCHIAALVEKYERHFSYQYVECKAAWVAETTADGRVKYHVLLAVRCEWEEPKVERPDVLWPRSQHPAWRHGPVQAFTQVKTVAALRAVLEQMEHAPTVAPLPRKAHSYAINAGWSGGKQTAAEVRWRKLPRYVREKTAPQDRIRKVKGGYAVNAYVWPTLESKEGYAMEEVLVATPYKNVWNRDAQEERYTDLREAMAKARRRTPQHPSCSECTLKRAA